MNPLSLRLLDKVVPERLLSRLVGHAARVRWPRFVLHPFLRWYANHFGVDLSEAEFPLEAYPSFVAFFTRRLRPGLRPISEEKEAIISPVDGAVYASGEIEKDTFLLAKGHPYTVSELVGDEASAESFIGGSFLTVYLSPKDYHRIHSPCEGEITGFQYIPGKLLPVNPPSAKMFSKLFCENERLTTFITMSSGAKIAMVKVGATNVGRIRLSYYPYVTNRWLTALPFGHRHEFPEPLPLKRGDEVGMFEMGSTVVLLFSPGFSIESFAIDEVLRLGQRISSLPA